MKTLCLLLSCFLILLGLTGCAGYKVSKPYVMKMDRVDQNLETGNRGYLYGTPPPVEERNELKREFIAVDIDLPGVVSEEGGLGGAKRIVETRREATVAKEETATSLREKVVKEEEIK